MDNVSNKYGENAYIFFLLTAASTEIILYKGTLILFYADKISNFAILGAM